MKTSKPPIAVTMGDPAGAGPMLVAAAREQSRTRNIPAFTYYAPGHERAFPGVPDVRFAKAIVKSIETAVKAVQKGEASAVVTCPVNKKILLDAGFRHAGHTEFLGELAKIRAVMMLTCEGLRTVPVTVHLPLREAVKKLSKNLIVETGKIVATDLAERFNIKNPRLAVTGLNPHAGEGGALGSEEQKIITPAIAALQKAGIFAEGPFPADTAFIPAMRMKYDAYLAMTHDQALIPVKTLDFRRTVNITLGLPFVRTSPAHGTAFELIRDGGTPDPESFIQALIMADQLSS